MNNYIVLDGLQYRTPHGYWEPIYGKPSRVQLTISGAVDATFGPATLTGWRGSIIGPVTPDSEDWGAIGDLRTTIQKVVEVEMSDHYGIEKTVIIAGPLTEESKSPKWDGASNEIWIDVDIYITGDVEE